MKYIITESQYSNFIRRRLSFIEPLVDREIKDQDPCYYKKQYGDYGVESYYLLVRDVLRDFIIQEVPNYWEMEDEQLRHIDLELSFAIDDLFKEKIISHYNSIDCD